MNNILNKICELRKDHYKKIKTEITLSEIESNAKYAPVVRPFREKLCSASVNEYGLIGEIKKASPSAGLIKKDFYPKKFAKDYENGGASCLSVLTEEKFFQGNAEDLKKARKNCSLPVIRKDFILEPYQVFESRAIGADCILLILSCISDFQAQELEAIALELGMDVLIEVHDENELERALKMNSRLIGINNRNLNTLITDISVTKRLIKYIPSKWLVVAESGLKTSKDLAELAEQGARCFLIGEALMKKRNLCLATRKILEKPYR